MTNNTIKSICKQRTHKRWQKFWNICPTGRQYNELHSKVKVKTFRSHLPAFKEKLLLRIQTLTTNLRGENSWLANVQDDFSPLCECGEKETIRHILIDCSLLEDERTTLEDKIMTIYRKASTPYNLRDVNFYTLIGGETEVDSQTRQLIEDAVANFLVVAKKQI